MPELVWNYEAVSSWSTLLGALGAWGALYYLYKYTRRTTELRDEARRQTAIQSEAYEAAVMPLLVAEFSEWQLRPRITTDAVVLRNIGKGPALGVQVEPIRTGTSTAQFDYIPLLEAGASTPIICVRETPRAPSYPEQNCAGDLERLVGYARQYVMVWCTEDPLRIVARSLSNTVHESLFKVELRGSDRFAVLVFKGRESRLEKAQTEPASASAATAGNP